MPYRTRYTIGEKISGWQIEKLLGTGGNGEVWRAVRAGSTAAVKFLKQVPADSEPYKRFVNETTVLRQLGVRPGILPLLDAHLPLRPTKMDPAWFSMPIAVPIRKALPARCTTGHWARAQSM
jgi:serine/threonine protein kinase